MLWPSWLCVCVCNICNCRSIMNASAGGSVHLSVCNWNLLRSVLLLYSSPSPLSLSSSALCIVLCWRCLIYYEIRTWLLVFQMLSAQAIISNSPGCRKKKNERRKCNAPPAGKLLIDTHSVGTPGNPGTASHPVLLLPFQR